MIHRRLNKAQKLGALILFGAVVAFAGWKAHSWELLAGGAAAIVLALFLVGWPPRRPRRKPNRR